MDHALIEPNTAGSGPSREALRLAITDLQMRIEWAREDGCDQVRLTRMLHSFQQALKRCEFGDSAGTMRHCRAALEAGCGQFSSAIHPTLRPRARAPVEIPSCVDLVPIRQDVAWQREV
jgi:hypothetical protein